MKFKEKVNTWIFDLDNTLYSADSGIFQQVHKLMGEFISKNLSMEISEAKKLQSKYYKQHGTTLRGLMDNHGIDPDHFLDEVHRLDYSIVGSNKILNELLSLISIFSKIGDLPVILFMPSRTFSLEFSRLSKHNTSKSLSRRRVVTCEPI